MRHSIVQRVRWTVILALALALGAMLRYPGGTPLDGGTEGYSMSRNFLSDLGMTVAYNRQPNRLGASLFVASLLLLIIGLGGSLAMIVRLHWADPASRRWAKAAAACGLLACAAFAGVAVTPENHVMSIHVSFTVWAWRLTPLVAGFMTLASLESPLFRPRVPLVWLALTMLLGSYAAFLAWGPSVLSVYGLPAQVIAQKVATVLVTLGLFYIANEADRVGAYGSSRLRANERRAG